MDLWSRQPNEDNRITQYNQEFDHYNNLNKLDSVTAIVIDDSLDIVELFTSCLSLKGFKVLGKGYDGKDAVDLFEKYRPDIVFLDIMMPKYDGFYALEKIREIDPHAKVLMITADMSSETAMKLKKQVCTAVMYKPFNFEELLKVVDMLLGSSLVNNIAFKGSTLSLI